MRVSVSPIPPIAASILSSRASGLVRQWRLACVVGLAAQDVLKVRMPEAEGRRQRHKGRSLPLSWKLQVTDGGLGNAAGPGKGR
jgi:hypothetical protein